MAVQPFSSPHVLQTDNCATFDGVALFGICPGLRPNNLQNVNPISNPKTKHPSVLNDKSMLWNKQKVIRKMQISQMSRH